MVIAAVTAKETHAQSVTYNHDSPKQNQITVMETGTGALSPDLYYTLLHNNYKKSAASCNLQIFLCLFLEKLNMPQNTPVTKAS